MFKFLTEKWSTQTKRIVTVVVVVGLLVGGIGGYLFYDYSQNNPNFCMSCHLMQGAFDAWKMSSHKGVNCHECHHLSPSELQGLMYSFAIKRTKQVPERHGKIIVSGKFCVKCHWDKNDKEPNAPNISKSNIHAKHYFSLKVECAQCHGFVVHKFEADADLCKKCHEGKEVHGMQEVACLNCHTDKTADLKPDRDKCLFCHGSDQDRKKLASEGRADVKKYAPSDALVAKAVKIVLAEGAPMQFSCYECHKPHTKARPDWDDCNRCHRNVKEIGKHGLHFSMGMNKCSTCHKPHTWVPSPAVLKSAACTKCHPASKNAKDFLH